MLLPLPLITVHALVSLGKEKRKVKNKNRGKMKDMPCYMRETVVSQNITLLKIKNYVSRKSMQ
jgi:hypothetical protein